MFFNLKKTAPILFSTFWIAVLSGQDCSELLSVAQSCDDCAVCTDGSTGLTISVTATNALDAQWQWYLHEDESADNPRIIPLAGPELLFQPIQVESDICEVCPSILGIMVDACDNSGYGEGNNEFMVLHSGSGFRGSGLQVDFGFQGTSNIDVNNDINIGANACTFREAPEDALMQNLQTGAPACTFQAVGPNTLVPADALVLIFTSSSARRPYNLSALCQPDETIYVLQNACEREPSDGAFSNNTATSTPFITKLYLNNCDGGCQSFFTYDRNQVGNSRLESTFVYKNNGEIIYNYSECSVPVGFELNKPQNLYKGSASFEFSCDMIDILKSFTNQSGYIIGSFETNGTSCFPETSQTQPTHLRYSDQCGSPSMSPLPPLCSGQSLDLSEFVINPENKPISFSGADVVGTTFIAPSTPSTYFISLEGNCEPIAIEVGDGETVQVKDSSFCAQSDEIELSSLVVQGVGTWQLLNADNSTRLVTDDDLRGLNAGTYQLIYVGCGQDTATVQLLPVGQPRVRKSKVCRGDATFEFAEIINGDSSGEWLFEGQLLTENEFVNFEAGSYTLLFQPSSPCSTPLNVGINLIQDPEPSIRDTTICRSNEPFDLLSLLSSPSSGKWEDVTNPFFPSTLNSSDLNLNRYASGSINLRFLPDITNQLLCKSTYPTIITLLEANDQFDTIPVCGTEYQLPNGQTITQDTTLTRILALANCDIEQNTTYLLSPFDIRRGNDTIQTCAASVVLENGETLTPATPTFTERQVDSMNCVIIENTFVAEFSNGGSHILPADTICYGVSIQIDDQDYSFENLPEDTIFIPNIGCDSTILTDSLVFLPPIPDDTLAITICDSDTFQFVDIGGNVLDVFTIDMGTTQNQFYNNYSYENGCIGNVTLELAFTDVLVEDTSIVAPCDVQQLEYNGILFTPEKRTHDFVIDTSSSCNQFQRVTVFFRNLSIFPVYDTTDCGATTYRDPFESAFHVVQKNMPDTIIYDYDLEGCITGGRRYIISFPEGDTITPEIFTCQGDSVQIGNQYFTESNLPAFINVGVNRFGCDSVVNSSSIVFGTGDTILSNYTFCGTDSFQIDTDTGLVILQASDFNAFPATRFFVRPSTGCSITEEVQFLDGTPKNIRTQIDTCYADSIYFGGVLFTPANNIQRVSFGDSICTVEATVQVNFTPAPQTFPVFRDTADCGDTTHIFELRGQTVTASVQNPTDTIFVGATSCLGDAYPYEIYFPTASDTTNIGNVQLCSSSPFVFNDPKNDTSYTINQDGPFTIILTNDLGCDSIIIGNLQRSSSIFASLTGDNTVCTGDSATLFFEILGAQALDLQISTGNTPLAALTQAKSGDSLRVAPTATTIYQLAVLNAGQLPCPPLSSGNVHEVVVEALDYSIQQLDVTCVEPGSVSIDADAEHQVVWADGNNSKNRIFENAGTYAFTISKNNCVKADSVVLKGENATASVETSDLSCTDEFGDIRISISDMRPGVRAYLKSEDVDTMYILQTQPYQIEQIVPGRYFLEIEDSIGCGLYKDSLFITKPAQIDLPELADSTLTAPTSITQNLLLSEAPTLSWSPSDQVACLNSACNMVELTIDKTTTFSYDFLNTNICSTGPKSVTYSIIDAEFSYPNAIVAGDGNGFTIHSPDEQSRIQSVQIFDRWGTLVFEQNDIPMSDKMLGWDGVYKDELLPSGIYLFTASILKSDGARTNLSGDILLVRK